MNSVTWGDAEMACLSVDRLFAAAHTTYDYSEMQEALGSNAAAWIGATDFDTEGTYTWPDGRILDSSAPWSPGEPNGASGENCVEMYSSGVLNDLKF